MIASSQSLKAVLFPLSNVPLFPCFFSALRRRGRASPTVDSLPTPDQRGLLHDPTGSGKTHTQPQSCPDSLKNHTFYTLTKAGNSTGRRVINDTIWLLKILLCCYLRPIHPQVTAFSRLPYAQYACEAQLWVHIYIYSLATRRCCTDIL